MSTTQRLNTLEKRLIAGGFVLFTLACVWVPLRLPLFHQCDELHHFDYCLKIARHGHAEPTQPLEADLMDLARGRLQHYKQFYQGLDIADARIEAEIIPNSYEAYQAPVFYWLAAGPLRLMDRLGWSLSAMVFSLRVFCALLVIGARVLTFLALARFGRPVALAALPFVLFFIPVDLLRVSNDGLVVLVASAVLLGLTRLEPAGYDEPPRRHRPGRFALLLGFGLLLAVATKVSAGLLLMPAAAVLLAVCWRAHGWRPAEAVALLGPPVAVGLVMAIDNYMGDGTLTGSAHLVGTFFPPRPQGFDPASLVPTVAEWLQIHKWYLLIETLLQGRRGGELYYHDMLVTIEQIGLVVSLGVAAWGARPNRRRRLGWDDPTEAMQRRWTVAAWIVMLLVVIQFSVLWTSVVRVYYSMRIMMPVELMFVLPAAMGWAYLTAFGGRWAPWARRLIWAGAAGLFAQASWFYLTV